MSRQQWAQTRTPMRDSFGLDHVVIVFAPTVHAGFPLFRSFIGSCTLFDHVGRGDCRPPLRRLVRLPASQAGREGCASPRVRLRGRSLPLPDRRPPKGVLQQPQLDDRAVHEGDRTRLYHSGTFGYVPSTEATHRKKTQPVGEDDEDDPLRISTPQDKCAACSAPHLFPFLISCC
jgi:hypothetical protein